MTKFLTITVVTLRAMLLLAPTISPAKMIRREANMDVRQTRGDTREILRD